MTVHTCHSKHYTLKYEWFKTLIHNWRLFICPTQYNAKSVLYTGNFMILNEMPGMHEEDGKAYQIETIHLLP